MKWIFSDSGLRVPLFSKPARVETTQVLFSKCDLVQRGSSNIVVEYVKFGPKGVPIIARSVLPLREVVSIRRFSIDGERDAKWRV